MPPLPSSGKYGSPMPWAPLDRDGVAAGGRSRPAQEEGEGGQEHGTTGQHGCNVSGMTLRRGRRPVTLALPIGKRPGTPPAHVRGGVS